MPGTSFSFKLLIFLLAALLCGGLPAKSAHLPIGLRAKDVVGGIRLHATLPYDHYGPRDPVKVYLTFLNTARCEVTFSRTASIVVEVQEKERRLSFKPIEAKRAGQVESLGESVTLEPGRSFLRAVVIEKGHAAFLPGKHPIRVYCTLGGSAGSGKRPLTGILRSNRLTLDVQYNVIMVY